MMGEILHNLPKNRNGQKNAADLKRRDPASSAGERGARLRGHGKKWFEQFFSAVCARVLTGN